MQAASITRVIRPAASAPANSQHPVTNGAKAPEVVDISDEDDKRQQQQQQRRVLVTTNNGVNHLPPNTTYRVVTAPQVRNGTTAASAGTTGHIVVRSNLIHRHPAPLPPVPPRAQHSDPPSWKLPPPKPFLKISKLKNGIVLSWNIMQSMAAHASLATFQIYAYQENPGNANQPVSSNLWKKVGDVKALPLPMACTLTQFQSGHKYHFAVRAQDNHSRIGAFSEAQTISLI